MTDRMKRRHGKTSLVNLIVIGLVFIVVLVLLLSHRCPLRRLAQSAACQTNLMGIGKAMIAYEQQTESPPLIKAYEAVPNGANSAPTEANETDYPLGGRHPRPRDRAAGGRRRSYPDAGADDVTWEVLGDQAMQNVWLLVVAKNVPEKIFRCPADELWEPRGDDAAKYGWTDPHQYSYGMQWPYQTDAADNTNPAPLRAPQTVIMADLNPGGPVDKSRLPSNHSKYGTNCVLSDGSIATSRKDGPRRPGLSTLGFEGDEIYTNAAGVAGGLPQSTTDTSITLSGR